MFLAAFVNSKNRFCEALNDAFLRSWERATFSWTTNELFWYLKNSFSLLGLLISASYTSISGKCDVYALDTDVTLNFENIIGLSQCLVNQIPNVRLPLSYVDVYQTIVDEARINLETFVEQSVVIVIHFSTLRLLEVGVTVLRLKKEKQILLIKDFSKSCQNWILQMFLEWNTAKSKFF